MSEFPVRVVQGPLLVDGARCWSCFNETEQCIELDLATPSHLQSLAIRAATPIFAPAQPNVTPHPLSGLHLPLLPLTLDQAGA
jgi:hypothetical protein